VPYSSLENVIESSKEAYYLALRQTQGTLSDDAPWRRALDVVCTAKGTRDGTCDRRLSVLDSGYPIPQAHFDTE
jgi:hypothetical protein